MVVPLLTVVETLSDQEGTDEEFEEPLATRKGEGQVYTIVAVRQGSTYENVAVVAADHVV